MRCAKTAEPVEMLFGMWTCVGLSKHALDGVHIGATWQIRLNRQCVVALRPFCQITVTTFHSSFTIGLGSRSIIKDPTTP